MKSKITRVFLASALGIFLSACGGGGDDADDKTLFSLWKRVPDGAPVDLSTAAFNTPSNFVFFDLDGSRCSCEMVILGDNASGVASISSCTYVSGSGPKDPGCSARNGGYRYTNSDATLTLTAPNGTTSTFK